MTYILMYSFQDKTVNEYDTKGPPISVDMERNPAYVSIEMNQIEDKPTCKTNNNIVIL